LPEIHIVRTFKLSTCSVLSIWVPAFSLVTVEMPAVIKIVVLRLKPGTTVDEVLNGPGKESLRELVGLLKAAPGNEHVYCVSSLLHLCLAIDIYRALKLRIHRHLFLSFVSIGIQDSVLADMLTDWDSYEHHKAYEEAPQYKTTFIPLLASLVDLSGGPPLKSEP
jgi:hypothetical protein